MNLQQIEMDLKTDGYHAFYHRGRLVITKFIKDETTGEKYGDIGAWYVYLENNKYIVEHADGNIPIMEEFSSKEDVLDFIRKNFPL